jgi:hypothetical protein
LGEVESIRDGAPKAVQDCHALILWLIPQLDKLPRVRRFTLGARLEDGLLEVLELVVQAAYTREKTPILQRANLKLEPKVRRFLEQRAGKREASWQTSF